MSARKNIKETITRRPLAIIVVAHDQSEWDHFNEFYVRKISEALLATGCSDICDTITVIPIKEVREEFGIGDDALLVGFADGVMKRELDRGAPGDVPFVSEPDAPGHRHLPNIGQSKDALLPGRQGTVNKAD